MGIPFYFKTIVKRYPHVIVPVDGRLSVDRIFLDFNSMIHNSARAVLDRQQSQLDSDAIDELIIRETIHSIETLLQSVVEAKTLVYVAVDGVCPRAKMNQQRKRRFVSAWRTNIIDDAKEKLGIRSTKWDTNAITPGTEFMKKLDIALHVFAKENRRVVVSGSNEPGEGEHKIFQYINHNPGSDNDVIYGLDADLILLSMINSNSNNIRLLRERPAFGVGTSPKSSSEYMTLDIKMLADGIYETYSSKTLTKQQFVKDYVMGCSLLGNDFLPPLSFLKIKDDGIDAIMEAYKNVWEETGQMLVDNTTLNNVALSNVLSRLSLCEDKMMLDVWDIWSTRQVRIDRHRNNRIDMIQAELDNYPSLNKSQSSLNRPSNPGWHQDYYKNLFQSVDVNQTCDSYIEGLHWIARYYLDYPSASQSWYYSYNYSPLIADVSTRLKMYLYDTSKSVSIDRTTATTLHAFQSVLEKPELQLLLVLPPQSSALVPTHLRPIMNSLVLGCLHYYPTCFKLSIFLKYYLWECSPLLPDIDIEHIISQSAKCW